MNPSDRTEYDRAPYPSSAFPQTTADRLATNAALFGLNPPPAGRARVLELGCGEGTNLITMAFGLPEARFVGIDLAGEAVARGRELIDSLGLRNIELRRMNLLDTPGDLGTFDYIIAHGIYSWVPAAARDKILEACGKLLSEQGIAYVSYNAHPGNHLRDAIRHMLHFHSDRFEEPVERVRQARALLKFAAEAKTEPELWQTLLARQLERIGQSPDMAFYHDDLSPVNDAVYFHEFVEHAGRHGLEYLCEAHLADMMIEGFTEETRKMLSQLEDNVIAREQYADFLLGRAFRQTLLCRRGLVKDRALDTARVPAMSVVGDTRPANGPLDFTPGKVEDFNGPANSVVGSGHPVVKAALAHLGTVVPLSVPFPELLERARGDCGHGGKPGAEEDSRALADFLARAVMINFVELHAHPPRFVTTVSERPTASALARRQLTKGNRVSTLRHRTLKIQDSFGRQLILLCDGTRDHEALKAGLLEAVRSGAATLEEEGKPVTDPEAASPLIERDLPGSLKNLARSAVLVA